MDMQAEIDRPSTIPRPIALHVQGMSCTNCALGVEKYLTQAGMADVSVDFATGEVNFQMPPQETPLPRLIKGIEQLGFSVAQDEEEISSEGWSKLEWLFAISLVLTFPLLISMFLPWAWLHHPWVQLAITTPVYALGAWHFGRSGWRSLQTGVPNMDVLIVIGATAAFGYSLYGTLYGLGPDFLFYETAASVITLVLLGNVIEHRAVQRTTSAVKALTHLQPKTARKILDLQQPQQAIEVAITTIKEGDYLLVPAGQQVPVDGQIVEGSVEVDEAMLTGEAAWVSKSAGDEVFGGTVVQQGHAILRATKVGQATTLAQIIKMVKQAQRDKPALQQMADRIAAVFVPIVLGISVLTFAISSLFLGISGVEAMIRSIAVLVIACPCAMGLATPTAVVVGIGRASRQGMLIKGARTLEQFAGIKRMVFDKTGTLTTGQFTLTQIHPTNPDDLPSIQSVLVSLEGYSQHPIAQSIQTALAGVSPMRLHQVSEIKGIGMSAMDERGHHYQLGSYRIAEGLVAADSHTIYLLKDGAFWAGIDLRDEVRPGVAEAIAYFHQRGIETVLLSGDREDRCQQVAKQVGIQQVFAEQLPDEKLAHIKQLSTSKPTAMVGDGINDAPALAQATVGISLGQATDIAVQSAQVILLRNDLRLLPSLHQISIHTLKTIKQNLFWAFFYNVIAIPLAAGGLLRPMIAAASMALSDIFVIGNSLRLRVKPLSK